MTLNFNDAPEQLTPVPAGIYQVKATVKPGGVGPDGALRIAKNMRSQMLELELTIVGGKHNGRRLWDYTTVNFDAREYPDLPDMPSLDREQRDKFETSVRLGQIKLKAILDSAYALDPTDHSEAAEQKRALTSYFDFDGLKFWCWLDVRKGDGKYRDSNSVGLVIVPNMPEWAQRTGGAASSAAPALPSRSAQFSDEVPFAPEIR